MRKISHVLALVAALLLVPASAQSAPLRALKPRLLSTATAWVGQLDATRLAYGDRRLGASVEVLADAGAPRAVKPPAGCGAAAAGSGHLLFDCPTGAVFPAPDTRRVVVTASDGTPQAAVAYTLPRAGADGSEAGWPEAIGAEWIRHSASCYHCATWTEDVNWHTGDVRQPDLSARTSYEDLDATGLTTPLCAPLKLMPGPGDDQTPVQLGVQVSGARVLQEVAVEKPEGDALAWRLRRCGSSEAYKMPAGRTPLALRGAWVVLARPLSGQREALELLRLRDGRRFAVAGAWSQSLDPTRIVATARRLLVLGDAASTTSLWSVALPQK
jgi:hypothetical protein